MKSLFIQYGRFFLLAFVVGFLFPRLSAGTVLTSSTDYEADYERTVERGILNEMITNFHGDMNSKTN